MKKKIQPKYQKAKVTCLTCGNTFELGSTEKEIKVDTCEKCHPFYTGQQTATQAQGRVEKFNKRHNYDMNKLEKKEAKETKTKEK